MSSLDGSCLLDSEDGSAAEVSTGATGFTALLGAGACAGADDAGFSAFCFSFFTFPDSSDAATAAGAVAGGAVLEDF